MMCGKMVEQFCSNKTDLRERLYAEAETGWH